MNVSRNVSTPMDHIYVHAELDTDSLQMGTTALVIKPENFGVNKFITSMVLSFQILMNAAKEVTGVTKTVITVLDHMPVAVTVAIGLVRMECLAMVYILEGETSFDTMSCQNYPKFMRGRLHYTQLSLQILMSVLKELMNVTNIATTQSAVIPVTALLLDLAIGFTVMALLVKVSHPSQYSLTTI